MDTLLASAYAIVTMYVGFVIGVLVRSSYVERRPPGGGESPPPQAPQDLGPDDWAEWEEEFASSSVS
jgi:hypothetical protein